MSERSIQQAERGPSWTFTPLAKIVLSVLGFVAGCLLGMTAIFHVLARFRLHVAILALGLSVGCSTMPQVTSQDLDRLTNDLAVVHSALAAIDTSKLPDREKHALEDVKVVSGKAVTVSDLLSRVAKGGQ